MRHIVRLLALLALLTFPTLMAGQAGTQRITWKGCGISFNALALSSPWNVSSDRGTPAECLGEIQSKLHWYKDDYGSGPEDFLDSLSIQVQTGSHFARSVKTCDEAYKSQMENPDMWVTMTPGFLPADWYSRTTMMARNLFGEKNTRGERHQACFDLPQGIVEVTVSMGETKIDPSEYSTIRTVLSAIGVAMRSPGGGNRSGYNQSGSAATNSATSPSARGSTRTLLVPLPCSREGELRSAGAVPSSVEFSNGTANAVIIYWLNASGARQRYNQLAPGASYVQSTYRMHGWLVTNVAGTCLMIYLPNTALARADIR